MRCIHEVVLVERASDSIQLGNVIECSKGPGLELLICNFRSTTTLLCRALKRGMIGLM